MTAAPLSRNVKYCIVLYCIVLYYNIILYWVGPERKVRVVLGRCEGI